MIFLWIIIIVIVTIVGKKVFNHYHSKGMKTKMKIVTLLTTLIQCVLVYYFIRTLMPYMIHLMEIFYR